MIEAIGKMLACVDAKITGSIEVHFNEGIPTRTIEHKHSPLTGSLRKQ